MAPGCGARVARRAVVGEVRNRRLRLAGRQTVGGRRGRAVGRRGRVVGHRDHALGRRDRVVLRPVLVAARRGHAVGPQGRRIGAVAPPARVVGHRDHVAAHPARVGQAVARRERVFRPPDAVRASGLGVVLSRVDGR